MFVSSFRMAGMAAFVACVLVGCSQEPKIEKEVVQAPSAGKKSSSPDAGNLGASHPQEMALEQKQQLDSADSGMSPHGANPHAVAPAPVEMATREGFYVANAAGSGGTLHFLVPEAWKESPAKSSMRLLQLAMPGEAGEGELAVFYFGPSAGSVQMNIDRWIGQFTQPDGSSSKDKAAIEEVQGEHHATTFLDLSGTMAASNMPGMPAQGEQSGYRMLAAVVNTPSGPWFIKATGPEATMGANREGFLAMCKSAQLGG